MHTAWGIHKIAKEWGAVFTDDRHFVDDCAKILEAKFTSHNSDYTPCFCREGERFRLMEKYKYCPSCGKLL